MATKYALLVAALLPQVIWLLVPFCQLMKPSRSQILRAEYKDKNP